MTSSFDLDRRRFFRRAAMFGAAVSMPSLIAACGGGSESNAGSNTSPAAGGSTAAAQPKGEKIKIGFIALTDDASVVMAHELGLYAKHGVNVEVVKEASWANIRDKLLSGELQAAHCLFGMPFSVYTGVGGTAGKEMYVAMMLNTNGQAITLAKDVCGSVGYGKVEQVAAFVEGLKAKKTVTFAMTFPGGTHDLWLRYWLAAAGVDQSTVKIITIPPPQMVANMKVGNMDGFCVGEPWNGVAVKEGIGTTHITTQDMWTHHPEKALVANKEFATNRRADLKAVMKAVLEASAWLDVPENRRKAAEVIGRPAYVNASADVIDARLEGKYDLGCSEGAKTFTDTSMLFSRAGIVNMPRRSHAVWFMTQYARFGYLKELPDVAKVANTLILSDLYAEAAKEMGLVLPDDDMKPFSIKLDAATFDPSDPAGYLRNVGIKKAS